MAKVRFLYDNRWRAGTIYNYSTQHNSFPATASQHPWPKYPWRSRYGSGSGWGRFVVTDNASDRLDFDEGGSALVASLAPGTYSAITLASHIQTQMNAVGSGITVSHSDSTNKFTIAKASGTLNLRWNTGANAARSVGGTIGFDVSTDDTGALSYPGDYRRIHTSEEIDLDLGSVESANTIAIFGHNLQAGASIHLQGSDSSTFATIPFSEALTIDQVFIFDILASSAYRYRRLLIADWDNPDGYVQIGFPVMGSLVEFSRNCVGGWELGLEDPSQKIFSDGRQLSANKRQQYHTLSMDFENMSLTDLSAVMTMFAQAGTTEPLLVAVDSAAHQYDWTWLMTMASPPKATVSKVKRVQFRLSFEEVL